MTSEIEPAVADMYRAAETIARVGGYREKAELLEAMDAMAWFDNFGEPLYRRRMNIVRRLAEDVKREDWPEYLNEVLEAEA